MGVRQVTQIGVRGPSGVNSLGSLLNKSWQQEVDGTDIIVVILKKKIKICSMDSK